MGLCSAVQRSRSVFFVTFRINKKKRERTRLGIVSLGAFIFRVCSMVFRWANCKMMLCCLGCLEGRWCNGWRTYSFMDRNAGSAVPTVDTGPMTLEVSLQDWREYEC